MSGAMRRSAAILALICVTTLTGACTQSEATGTAAEITHGIDVSRLPRVDGAKQIFTSPYSTIFTAPGTVKDTAATLRKTLSGIGWKSFVSPGSGHDEFDNVAFMNFKKGPQALSVMVNLAPAQNNATAVSYTAVALPIDLPFPNDATAIEYDYDKPQLICLTEQSIEPTLAFYRKELGALGWSLWSAKLGDKAPDGDRAGELTQGGAYAFYAKTGKKPLVLTLRTTTDSKLKVEIKSYPMSVLEAQHRAAVSADARAPGFPVVVATPPAARPAPVAKAAPVKPAGPDLGDEIRRLALKSVQDAMAGVDTGKGHVKPVVQPAPQAQEKPVAGKRPPLPVTADAQEVDYNDDNGSLDFTSPASVKTVADFYRAEMKRLGWQESSPAIVRPKIVMLNYAKGDDGVQITINASGTGNTNVSASGTALKSAAAKAKPPSPEDLEVTETAGLPVPKAHEMAMGERTGMRVAVKAEVRLPFATTLEFYRRELGKRHWQEIAAGAVIAADHAAIAFTAPEGPAMLKLERKGGHTMVDLSLKDTAKAAKSGMVPKPGQAKLLFGNMTQADATITIKGKTIKIKAGAGSKKPDGPTLDLPPGKYTYSVKMAGGGGNSTDTVQLAADQTWGILVGPGGVLPMQMY
jgi:hypothetical protein